MRSGIELDDLILVEANTEQWRQTQVHGHASWGSGLSIADYQRREEELCRLSEFGRKGNHTGWSVLLNALRCAEPEG